MTEIFWHNGGLVASKDVPSVAIKRTVSQEGSSTQVREAGQAGAADVSADDPPLVQGTRGISVGLGR